MSDKTLFWIAIGLVFLIGTGIFANTFTLFVPERADSISYDAATKTGTVYLKWIGTSPGHLDDGDDCEIVSMDIYKNEPAEGVFVETLLKSEFNANPLVGSQKCRKDCDDADERCYKYSDIDRFRAAGYPIGTITEASDCDTNIGNEMSGQAVTWNWIRRQPDFMYIECVNINNVEKCFNITYKTEEALKSGVDFQLCKADIYKANPEFKELVESDAKYSWSVANIIIPAPAYVPPVEEPPVIIEPSPSNDTTSPPSDIPTDISEIIVTPTDSSADTSTDYNFGAFTLPLWAIIIIVILMIAIIVL